jgi:hypothetical protein
MKLATPHGQITVVNETAYTFGSTDNARSYPYSKTLGEASQPASVHGLLLGDEPLAVFGATGGSTSVHEHSALCLDGALLLALGDSVVSVKLQPFELRWVLRVDDATCFGLHFHQKSGSLISHGELSISRFTEDGAVLWQSYGADILTGSLGLHDEFVTISDFNGRTYRFKYGDGTNAG